MKENKDSENNRTNYELNINQTIGTFFGIGFGLAMGCRIANYSVNYLHYLDYLQHTYGLDRFIMDYPLVTKIVSMSGAGIVFGYVGNFLGNIIDMDKNDLKRATKKLRHGLEGLLNKIIKK